MQRTRWGIFCSLPLEYVCFSRNHFGILSDCTVKASLPEKSERRHLRCGRQLDRRRFHRFLIINYKYHPVYQYTLDGQEYRVVSRVEYSKKDEIKVGSYEVLFVDEKNPRYFSCPLRIGNV